MPCQMHRAQPRTLRCVRMPQLQPAALSLSHSPRNVAPHARAQPPEPRPRSPWNSVPCTLPLPHNFLDQTCTHPPPIPLYGTLLPVPSHPQRSHMHHINIIPHTLHIYLITTYNLVNNINFLVFLTVQVVMLSAPLYKHGMILKFSLMIFNHLGSPV